MTTDPSESTVSASVSPELKREIRIEAARREVTMSDLMRDAIEKWADENLPDHEIEAAD